MERDKNYDLELAGYIWSILKSNLPVLMSWGVEIETMKVITCGLEFKVNGFKHTGKVQIVLNEGADLFEVCLIGEDYRMFWGEDEYSLNKSGYENEKILS